MPAYTPVKLMNQMLIHELELNNEVIIKQVSEKAFELAMRNSEAAHALFKRNNKLIEAMKSWVTQQQWLAFAEKYPSLKYKLINFSLLKENSIKILGEAQKTLPQVVAQQVNELIVRSNNRIEFVPHGRTGSMILKNRDLKVINMKHQIVINNIPIPLVTRKTRHFNAMLCSAGSSTKREILLLEKDDALLDGIYSAVKGKVNASQSIETVLQIVKQTTQTCFPNGKPERFIQQQLAAGHKIIPLSDFIKNKNGVCRHHTLLNAYLLSRLVEDHLIEGEVIHHRVKFGDEGAHTWNLFVNKKDNKTYSLDSLWDDITCINDNPGALDRLYRQSDVESEIKRRQYDAPVQQAKPEQQVGQIKNQAKPCLEAIKSYIENPQNKFICFWLFGGKSITLDNGLQKTLPHRVVEIYEAIRTGNLEDREAANILLREIKRIAQDAIAHPRPGRDGGTTRFYNEILGLSEHEPEFNSHFQLNL